jgi:hypothetical protein
MAGRRFASRPSAIAPSPTTGIPADLGHEAPLDQALPAGPGHFGDRVAEGCGIRLFDEVSERPGDAPGGDQLGAHLVQVADIALGSPLDQLLDELVELGGTQDAGRNRPVEVGSLLGHLGGVVAGVEMVGADDRDDEDAFPAALGPRERGRRGGLGCTSARRCAFSTWARATSLG